MSILLTGGAGYIGTHTAVELLAVGYDVVVIDNLANSSREAIQRIEKIAGKSVTFYEGDVRDRALLDTIFKQHTIDSVIHFAGLKAVGESVSKPLQYYRNNLESTLVLLEAMQAHQVTQFVFSSSATVYGTPSELPLLETSCVGDGITNPYGRSKYMLEEIIRDASTAWPELHATILRYFNPVGTHASGLIGEDPGGVPNNLLPFVAQVAIGKRDIVHVFGNDYDTIDGTGVRDYIHVVDLAKGHVAALEHSSAGVAAYNLATGHGTSVLELIAAFSEACGHEIPYQIDARRPGDIASCYASPELANQELGWSAALSIADACRDTWNWQSKNPDGYTARYSQ